MTRKEKLRPARELLKDLRRRLVAGTISPVAAVAVIDRVLPLMTREYTKPRAPTKRNRVTGKVRDRAKALFAADAKLLCDDIGFALNIDGGRVTDILKGYHDDEPPDPNQFLLPLTAPPPRPDNQSARP